MLNIEPKTLQGKIRQQSLQKLFTVFAFALLVLILVSEYRKYGALDVKYLVILGGVVFWNYKLAKEIKNLKNQVSSE